ncbi:putative ATPase [Thecaphora frezii]
MAPTASQPDSELLRAAAQADGTADPAPPPAPTPGRRGPKPKSAQPQPEEDPAVHEERLKKLKFLLRRSGVYSRIMGEKMEKERKARAEAAAKEAAKKAANAAATTSSSSPSAKPEENADADAPSGRARRSDAGRKRKADDYAVSNYLDQEDLDKAAADASNAKKQKTSDGNLAAAANVEEEGDSKGDGKSDGKGDDNHDAEGDADADKDKEQPKPKDHRTQPALVTGATMKDYQLDGLDWLVSLYENGLNGILADEMGLGKTLQTISFLAHLRGKGVWGPFLIVAPLSTINNWLLEFKRFTPDIPALMYHGTGPERKEMRRIHLQPPTIRSEQLLFPVVITSYEVVIRDRAHLANHPWKFIVVDEGHRLKNLNCRLVRELKTYKSANRLILTGTPLHNNLAELWSLLNFILPDIFDDLATFEAWFDFSDIHEDGANRILSKSDSANIITQLHEILKPFLLRRLKADVEANLPPKKEYLLYAPLTRLQKDLYDSIVNREIRKWLMVRKTGLEWEEIQEILEDPEGDGGGGDDRSATATAAGTRANSRAATPSKRGTPARLAGGGGEGEGEGSAPSTPRRSTRRAARLAQNGLSLQEDEDDAAYFERLEREANQEQRMLTAAERERQGKLYAIREAQKAINNMHLENMVMQARKICNHPFLFDWPIDGSTGQLVVNKDLINASGKMLMLNRLLDALFERGHKVLIFSQFTTMLDIIEEWANGFKGFRTCRIDGGTSQVERREQMRSFNEDKGEDACNLFLLSTRAGGLGINLVAADTVVFFDSDWNPQMDLQAQDRVHRIGQTKPCLVFRLVSANTVEQRVLKRAGNKRKLEALVIQQGKFRLPAGYEGAGGKGKRRRKEEEWAEMASNLLRLEGEQVELAGEDDEIISKGNLEKLLDRSPEAYERRTGWVTQKEEGGGEGKAAFEVTETVADEANEEIAKLLAS